MERYTVTGPVLELGPGFTLALSAEQALTRLHNLRRLPAQDEKTDPKLYETMRPVQFKRGESLGIAGDLGKTLVQAVAREGSPAAKAEEAAAKTDATARPERARDARPAGRKLV